MRKFYAFIAAALMSVSMLAAPASTPTVANLTTAGFDVTNNVVLCFYFDVAPCNAVVLAGSYNEWTDDVTKCIEFEALTGFDGWFVAETPYVEGIQAKPLQLKNGGFDGWAYQAGDPDAWINMNVDGSKTATIENGYEGEANVTYPSAGAYIYEIAYWKNHGTPCVFIPSHKYTVVFFAPECDYAVPALVGDFDNWGGTAMNKTTYDGDEAYVLEVESEEGKGFKFFDLVLKWGNEPQWYDAENETWKNFGNNTFPVATKDTTLVFDYYDELANPTKYKWPVCVEPEDASTVVLGLLAPAGAPAEGIEVWGTFNNWASGVAMEYDADLNIYATILEGKSTDSFKFRQTDTWDNQIQYKDEEADAWKTFGDGNAELKFGDYWEDGTGALAGKKVVALDFRDPAKFKWSVWEEGIENVVLTEKAQKVIIDGVLYIIRDNKMYNAQGTQVR